MNSHTRGFTLLEMLIAVAVLAIAMGALLAGFARYSDQAAYLRQRTVATWVAHNELTGLGLRGGFPAIGSQDGESEMGGATWKWRIDIAETVDPNLRRAEVRVYAPGTKADALDPLKTATAGRLTGFIANTQ